MSTVHIITLLLTIVIAIGILILILEWRKFRLWSSVYREDFEYWSRYRGDFEYRDKIYDQCHPYPLRLMRQIKEAERKTGVELRWTARHILVLKLIESLQNGEPLGDMEDKIITILRVTFERRARNVFPDGSSSSLMCACLSPQVSFMGPRPEACPVCGRSW